MQPESTNQPTENTSPIDPMAAAQPQPAPPNPQQQIITASYNPPLPSQESTSRFSGLKNIKKQRVVAVLAVAIVLLGGGSAAAYFGYVVPNSPDQLWEKSLSNSAKGYDKLVAYTESQKNIKGGTVKGTFKFDFKDSVVDGNVDVAYDDKNSSSKIDAGVAGTRFNLELLTNIPEGAKNPDIYAKVSGLKGIDNVLGATGAGIGQSLEQYDSQWFVVDHTLLDQAEKSGNNSSGAADLTSKDVVDFANAVGEPTKEYVFTTDESKAVFTVKENIGKEKIDNRSTYRYKVGVNKEHLKTYNNAVCDKIAPTKLFKALRFGQSEEEAKKQCKDTKDIDSLNESSTADVWVDTKTKLIRKVKFDDPKVGGDFAELGLNYNGGDEYPFFVTLNASEGDMKGKGTLGVTLNTKTNTSKITANFEGTESGQAMKFTLDVTAKPSNDKVEFKKPEGAKSILEAFGGLLGGFAPAKPMSGTGATGADEALARECTPALQAWAESGNDAAVPAKCRSFVGLN